MAGVSPKKKKVAREFLAADKREGKYRKKR
jgi:hypothetical protein